MQKKLVLLSLLGTLFFSGCSPYSATKYFEKDAFYSRAMQYTKKVNISDHEKVLAIFNATYLNSVDKEFNNNYENFIVGIYTADEKDIKTENILLNGQKAVTIKPLDQNGKLKNFPLKNHWAKYYLVSFERSVENFFQERKDNLTIEYTHINNQSVSLTFLKEL